MVTIHVTEEELKVGVYMWMRDGRQKGITSADGR